HENQGSLHCQNFSSVTRAVVSLMYSRRSRPTLIQINLWRNSVSIVGIFTGGAEGHTSRRGRMGYVMACIDRIVRRTLSDRYTQCRGVACYAPTIRSIHALDDQSHVHSHAEEAPTHTPIPAAGPRPQSRCGAGQSGSRLLPPASAA